MTPIVQSMLNDYCQKTADKEFCDPDGGVRHLTRAKCFDLTGVSEFLNEAYSSLRAADMSVQEFYNSGRIFLPAPVTVFEMNGSDRREMIMLIDQDNDIEVWTGHKGDPISSGNGYAGALFKAASFSRSYEDLFFRNRHGRFEEKDAYLAITVFVTLFFINTPHLVGNITRLPHSGLQRKLARKMGLTGKFPLHAWTEITLFVDPTGANAEAENREIEARLSGQTCLHFVRSFLRFRMGRLERVKAHWRGDASLGIKRSRYIVKPSLQHAPSP